MLMNFNIINLYVQHYTFLFWSPHLAEPVSTYIICMCLYKVLMYLTPGYFSHEFHNNYFRPVWSMLSYVSYYCAVSNVYFFCGFMLAFVNWFIAVTFFNV